MPACASTWAVSSGPPGASPATTRTSRPAADQRADQPPAPGRGKGGSSAVGSAGSPGRRARTPAGRRGRGRDGRRHGAHHHAQPAPPRRTYGADVTPPRADPAQGAVERSARRHRAPRCARGPAGRTRRSRGTTTASRARASRRPAAPGTSTHGASDGRGSRPGRASTPPGRPGPGPRPRSRRRRRPAPPGRRPGRRPARRPPTAGRPRRRRPRPSPSGASGVAEAQPGQANALVSEPSAQPGRSRVQVPAAEGQERLVPHARPLVRSRQQARRVVGVGAPAGGAGSSRARWRPVEGRSRARPPTRPRPARPPARWPGPRRGEDQAVGSTPAGGQRRLRGVDVG
jgi:hypothetical protein